MDRKGYIDLCRRYAAVPKGIHDQPLEPHPDLAVKYASVDVYYPIALQLSFSPEGTPLYAAVLREEAVNAVHYVPLGRVSKCP